MALDYVHIGHITILSYAVMLRPDTITIGLVSDEIIDRYKPRHHNYHQRRTLAYSLKGVDSVIREAGWPPFVETITRTEPAYVIHGDDWTSPDAPLYPVRQQIQEVVTNYGGELIEPEYTPGVNSTCIRNQSVVRKV